MQIFGHFVGGLCNTEASNSHRGANRKVKNFFGFGFTKTEVCHFQQLNTSCRQQLSTFAHDLWKEGALEDWIYIGVRSAVNGRIRTSLILHHEKQRTS
jgi:hypothetical protein